MAEDWVDRHVARWRDHWIDIHFDDEVEGVMERIGVTETVFPERDSALALGTRMSGHALLNYFKLGPGFGVQEMAVPSVWSGKTLRRAH